jgi:D-alanine-D-alanine ligase
MKITVLLGGPSDEREISLISGKAVADGLRAAGHEVFESDISPDELSGLDHDADVIFPVLHGAFGESGELQEILEERSVPFVGSGSAASRIGIDKIASKRAWQRAGLLTPAWEVVTRAAPLPTLPAPLVVKPIDSGSSLDVLICHTQLEVDLACDTILERHDHAMVETLIAGPEITVGLLEGEPLDPIRIITKHEFFDYDAKYKACGTEHRFDLGLPEHVSDTCRELAREANRVIGCRDLARVDLMLDKENTPHLIEINTMPGFTPMSLLPEAAAHGGITFSTLVDRLVRAAHARGAARPEVFVSTDAQVALPRVDVRDAARLKRRPPARKTA